MLKREDIRRLAEYFCLHEGDLHGSEELDWLNSLLNRGVACEVYANNLSHKGDSLGCASYGYDADKYKLSCIKEQKILYAEDDDETRYVMADILNDYVGKVFFAKNGAEAFEIFKREGDNIDLILADILMPGLNGIELLANVRSHSSNASMPFVLATAFSDTEYLLDSIKLKCNGYILKPVNLSELLDVKYAAILPNLQMRELARRNELLGALGTFIGGKKAEVVRYIIDNSDKEHIFHGGHEDVALALNATRQTVASVFQKLIDVGFLEKVKNKSYKLCNKDIDALMQE